MKTSHLKELEYLIWISEIRDNGRSICVLPLIQTHMTLVDQHHRLWQKAYLILYYDEARLRRNIRGTKIAQNVSRDVHNLQLGS
jgi:hypothetical protein